MLNQELLKEQILPLIFKDGEHYEKYRQVYARQAQAGEVVATVTADGLETINQAQEGDFIVLNQTDAKESYILRPEKFRKRYVLAEKSRGAFDKYQPIGEIMALEMTPERMDALAWTPEIYFEASWGAKMVLKAMDFLACPLDRSEIYRIARKEFFETYRLKGQ